jgi:hypothetical protein
MARFCLQLRRAQKVESIDERVPKIIDGLLGEH